MRTEAQKTVTVQRCSMRQAIQTCQAAVRKVQLLKVDSYELWMIRVGKIELNWASKSNVNS